MSHCVYKIDPEQVNFLMNKYNIEITYIVNGDESFAKNETKAQAIKIIHDGIEYRVRYSKNNRLKTCYELTEYGFILSKLIGRYDTICGCVDYIMNHVPNKKGGLKK